MYVCEVWVKVSSLVKARLGLQPHPFSLLLWFLSSLTVLLRKVTGMLRKMPVLVTVVQKQERVLCFCACRLKWYRLEPRAGHPCSHQEGRHLHSFQCGRGDPETCGEITKR